ncbi:MAG: hypothetical protein HQ472_07325 [Ignavibacteria bacterium]|nr:hypothetical protein [Ignavibacteria bacterium]
MRFHRIYWTLLFVFFGYTFLLVDTTTASDAPHFKNKCNLGSTQFSDQIASIRNGILGDRTRPNLPLQYDDPNSLFRVHYATSGENAIPLDDVSASGIPDYVEECMAALIYSRTMYLDSFNYAVPPTDGMEGGSPAVDVYLLDLSKAGQNGFGLYGETVPENLISAGPPERYTTWIQIDNDFSVNDVNSSGTKVFETNGIDALRITCSHEYHHVVQIGSYGIALTQLMMYEFTSTYYEQRLWPNVNDWHIYVRELLVRPSLWPMSGSQSSTGYVWSWFGNVLCSGDNQRVLTEVWDNIKKNTRPFEALVQACNSVLGRDLADVFCKSMSTLYYTGSRGMNNNYLRNAELLPELRLAVDEQAKPPSMLAVGDILPFEVRAFRYSIPSHSSALPKSVVTTITWPDINAFINSESLSRLTFTVVTTANPLGSDLPIAGTAWGVGISPTEVCYGVTGSQTTQPEFPFPHPVVLSQHQTTNFPVVGELPGNVVAFELLNTQLVGIDSGQLPVLLNDDRIVAQYNVPDFLEPGTYVVRIKSATSNSLYKIFVKR